MKKSSKSKTGEDEAIPSPFWGEGKGEGRNRGLEHGNIGIFELMEEHGHEEVLFCYNKPTKLKAIIAIHNTTLGSAIGGCRLWKYNSEEDALVDALKLSRIMTYQSAVADSDTGGEKAVLWRDFEEETDEAYSRAFGRFVEGLKGGFITYPDLGTDTQEMKFIKRETAYVLPYEAPTGIKAESRI